MKSFVIVLFYVIIITSACESLSSPGKIPYFADFLSEKTPAVLHLLLLFAS